MSGPASPSPNASAEYEAIAATISGTERGRWFLAEHARRNRGAETEMLLGAIARLERTVTADRGHEAFGHLRGNLVDMADAISRTKAEIAAISAANHEQTRLTEASLALDGIVRETERATSDILGSAEAIQEAAWTLREQGANEAACDVLDHHATGIYTACSFQDLTAQRIARIVYTLRYLEDRLSAMIAIWGEEAEPVPSLSEAGAAEIGASDLNQSDIDRYIGMDVPAVTAAALVARPGSLPLHEDLVFLPIAGEPDTEVAGPESIMAESIMAESVMAESVMADSVDDAPARDPPELAWAGLAAATPEPDGVPAPPGALDTALRPAPIGGLSPQQRLPPFA
ncbi:hypothetical protein MKK88_00690 [Methylobacterium sp. E-005]|uniref:hypothetical protein n=1 Tax=Methylobacterium sp. E-005 TaxID=2836549 RepID=UPI001FB96C63|nr:hypothetical protein [Methylobacterium sp. E-005]MCJ2084513.1 hypothetical protein [Methylobacterium sp. E-005]